MAHLLISGETVIDQENMSSKSAGKHKRVESDFQAGGLELGVSQKRRALASITNQYGPRESLSLSGKSCDLQPTRCKPSTGLSVSELIKP